MGNEVVREIKIWESLLKVCTRDMILLEEQTKVRLHGIFNLSEPCSDGDAVWWILEAFGLLDAVVRKEWAEWTEIDGRKDLRCTVPTLKKRSLGSSKDWVITVDFTIWTEI